MSSSVADEPPCLASERAVLGSILLAPRHAWPICSDVLKTEDFLHLAHRSIWSAMRAVAAEGAPIEEITVAARLVATEEAPRLRAVGGVEQYLIELSSSVITVENVGYHARQIKIAGAARRIEERFHDAAKHVLSANATPDDKRDAIEGLTLYAQGVADEVAPEFEPAESLALRVGYDGPRLQTGIETLDAAIGGGLPRNALVVVGGAPGAGKTTLLVQWARQLAAAGFAVGVLAADQPAEAVLIRWGQGAGCDRQRLERADPEERRKLAEAMRGVDLLVADATRAPVEIDRLAGALRRRREASGCAVSILVVDSLQTAPAKGTEDAADQRAAVEAVTRACVRAAQRHGHLVLATCELVKGAYRSRQSIEQTDIRAAFADSRAPLHAADLALLMRTPEEGGDVDVATAKSRLGNGALPRFRLHLDRALATYVEVESAGDDEEQVERTTAALDATKRKVLTAVEKAIEPLRTKEAVWRRSGGSRTKTWAALAELLEDGAIVQTTEGFKVGV